MSRVDAGPNVAGMKHPEPVANRPPAVQLEREPVSGTEPAVTLVEVPVTAFRVNAAGPQPAVVRPSDFDFGPEASGRCHTLPLRSGRRPAPERESYPGRRTR